MKWILLVKVVLSYQHYLITDLETFGTSKLIVNIFENDTQLCEGVLIQENLIVTASQCIQGISKIKVITQSHPKYKESGCYKSSEFEVIDFKRSQSPVFNKHRNSFLLPGLALLSLKSENNKTVNIKLAQKEMGLNAIMMLSRFTFNINANKTDQSPLLIKIIHAAHCNQFSGFTITSNEFCARTPIHPQPNIGSPAFASIDDNPVLMGVAIKSTSEMNGYTVYSRVDQVEWLSDYIKQ